MTHEDKELLLQDLSARLPYGQIVKISLFRNDGRKRDIDLDPHVTENIGELVDKYNVLPYLRPMSSMTEEEEIEYDATFATIKLADGHYDSTMTYKSFDFLNEHHFDYRGLIEKGLAISVTKENNPYKE